MAAPPDTVLYLCSIFNHISSNNFFLLFQKLVSKPDQLIKRRGKLGLIKVKTDLAESKRWIGERMGKDQQVGHHGQFEPQFG